MEPIKKEDARVLRTKKDLRAALLDLCRKQSFEKITVREICTHAGINKMTFYKHYHDKYELLDDMARAMTDEMVARTRAETFPPPSSAEDLSVLFADILIKCIEIALENKEAILSLGHASNPIAAEILYSAMERLMREIVIYFTRFFDVTFDREYAASFLSGGMATLIIRLLHQGEYDREKFRAGFRYSFITLLQAHEFILNARGVQ